MTPAAAALDQDLVQAATRHVRLAIREHNALQAGPPWPPHAPTIGLSCNFTLRSNSLGIVGAQLFRALLRTGLAVQHTSRAQAMLIGHRNPAELARLLMLLDPEPDALLDRAVMHAPPGHLAWAIAYGDSGLAAAIEPSRLGWRHAIGWSPAESSQWLLDAPEIAAAMNTGYDLWVTPSRFACGLYREGGVRIPMARIADPVDTELWARPAAAPRRQERPFTFATWGTWGARKLNLSIIDTFRRAFGSRDDVRLVLKTRFPNRPPESGRIHPNVAIISEDWTRRELVNFVHSQVDALVFLSLGEGFGMPPLEAVSAGVPTVLSDHSGLHEYITQAGPDRGFYPVRTRGSFISADPSMLWSSWWLPDLDHAVERMRYLVQHQDEARAAAACGSTWVHEHYGAEAFRLRLLRLLMDVGAVPRTWPTTPFDPA